MKAGCVHLTIEMDVPIDIFKRTLVELKGLCGDDSTIDAVVFYKRPDGISLQAISAIHESVFGGPMKILLSAEEVLFLKEHARGEIESDGSA